MLETSRQQDYLNDVCIVGVGETVVGKVPGYGSLQLQAWAARNAASHAGVALKEIDGLINQDPYSIPHSMFASSLAEYLGLAPTYLSTVDVGGSVTVMTMINSAALAIATGQSRYCLVAQGENMATGRPPGSQGHVLHTRQGADEFREPYGALGAPISYALLARRYKLEFGATEADFGAVAVQAREHAMLNPNRQTKRPLSMDEYIRSPMIADPLRRLDCSLVSDGGGALLLTTRKEARRRGLKAVAIKSFAMKATHNDVANAPPLGSLCLPDVARRSYEGAGVSGKDVDVVLVHDAFTLSVLVQLEGLGLASPGESGAMVRSGDFGLSGRWPVNPHGGLLGQAHFGGILHSIEATRQLLGEAGARQLNNVRQALLCGNGGIFSSFGVMVLGRL
jgi:acetyl-CoA acetyltransferase